jgi:hypothetical protein
MLPHHANCCKHTFKHFRTLGQKDSSEPSRKYMELHGRKSHEHAEHMTDDIGTKSSSQWHWHEVSSSRAASDALSCAGMSVHVSVS